MNPDTTPTPRTDALRYELENGVCKSKVDSLLCDPDRKVTGYFLTKKDGNVCMVDKGTVRWITKEEWWWIFHESDHYPKKGQLSDRDHNEVVMLREELEKAMSMIDRDMQCEEEVAQLRELLNRAIEMAEEAIRLADIDYENDKFGKVTWLKKEVAEIELEARLAPAPEEPKTYAHLDKCIGNVTKFTHEGNNDAKLKQSEWREVGLDEVICEGDECRWKGEAQYEPLMDSMIGGKSKRFRFYLFRTRRPLPTTNCKQISSKLVDEPKKDEMPLDADIASIEWSCVHTARAICYLRDEVQKLKVQHQD